MYDILYADPPWLANAGEVGRQAARNKKQTNKIDRVYDVMTKSELQAMRPQLDDWANPDSLLFMWVIQTNLPEAIALGEAWGFKYVTIPFVWDKVNTNLGYYTNPQCEIVLLFKKGKPTKALGKPVDKKVRQFVSEKRREHSRKPHAVREGIELLYPDAKKLELFARTAPEGWDVFGNETDKFTIN